MSGALPVAVDAKGRPRGDRRCLIVRRTHRQGALRATFDRASDRYQRARPEYPAELFEHLVRVAGLGHGDHLVVVGCSTGKATRPLAERGFRITCVELGPELAAAARNLAAFPAIEVVEGRLEEWRPQEGEQFDLVLAATAWHWIDPVVRYTKAWDVLRPGGHLGFWEAVHVFPAGGDPFFLDIQGVYEEIGEGVPAGTAWPRPGELGDRREEIDASGLFDVVDIRHFDWEQTCDADGYVDLLETFSGHIATEQWQRHRVYGEIRRRPGQRPDGMLLRHWGGVLHVARRREISIPLGLYRSNSRCSPRASSAAVGSSQDQEGSAAHQAPRQRHLLPLAFGQVRSAGQATPQLGLVPVGKVLEEGGRPTGGRGRLGGLIEEQPAGGDDRCRGDTVDRLGEDQPHRPGEDRYRSWMRRQRGRRRSVMAERGYRSA